jgi:hypothetical protein
MADPVAIQERGVAERLEQLQEAWTAVAAQGRALGVVVQQERDLLQALKQWQQQHPLV